MADDEADGAEVVDSDQKQIIKTVMRGLVPGERVLVTVEAALPDIVVVSLEHGTKNFQGALLDATKRGLPCGVEPPEPVKGPDGDKLSNIAARFSYFQEKRHSALPKVDPRRSTQSSPRSKNTRPTVRLRPRQVLCSKCRSICNENSENVGRKRKSEETVEQPIRRSDRRCAATTQQPRQPQQQPNTRSQRSLQINVADQSDESSSSKTTTSTSSSTTEQLPQQQQQRASKFSPSLIPKLSRLRPADITSASAHSAGLIKPCIKLAEKMRSAYWHGRDEEDLSQSLHEEDEEEEEELENRPMNGHPRAEPIELDSNPTQAYCATPRRLSSSSVESAKVPPEEEDKKTLAAADSTVRGAGRALRAQRKKRSIGLMEDLWDESVFEDPARMSPPVNTIVLPTRATPVIKISFGAQGEGTVLKIPSKIQSPYIERDVDTDTEEVQNEATDPLLLPHDYDGYCRLGRYEDDGQEQVDPQKLGTPSKDCDTASAKAAKKALKKAKKKALKRLHEALSPAMSPCNSSPRYGSSFDIMYHRRKHKVKHKKRHREERKNRVPQNSQEKEEPASGVQQLDCLGLEVMNDDDDDAVKMLDSSDDRHGQVTDTTPVAPTTTVAHNNNTAIKEQCLKQKLSISLKRLNTNAYAPRYEHHHSYPVSSNCKSSAATSEEEEEEDEESSCVGSSEHEVNSAETAPDFPPVEHPLVMRLTAAATPDVHCVSTGKRMDVGDVVWGKVHGFPWWPGKVLSITDSGEGEDPVVGPQAHVAWYGSSTSSLMSCDQLSPFLETFKSRYNKKKKGPYKEAIRQATNEAEARNSSQITPNSTSNVLDVCGSPCEVNVH
ncbi:uncharacterized protein LOC106637373 [Copidosoma floridanum]|uniref:uncharacterized protein LOC106637373 n=1 Tax=Copidosoma floridanum TaxID=29053 RepID=UPI0006C9A19F|nr:uncharacterized protein LOC106637373 [Copidosoma floridanum]